MGGLCKRPERVNIEETIGMAPGAMTKLNRRLRLHGQEQPAVEDLIS